LLFPHLGSTIPPVGIVAIVVVVGGIVVGGITVGWPNNPEFNAGLVIIVAGLLVIVPYH